MGKQRSGQADKRWGMTECRCCSEEDTHFALDSQCLLPYPFVELPHDYDEAVEKFGVEDVTKRGLATWRIAEYTQLLSEAMKLGNTAKTTRGSIRCTQKRSNQHGVHRFEDVEMASEGWKLLLFMYTDLLHGLKAKLRKYLRSYLEKLFQFSGWIAVGR